MSTGLNSAICGIPTKYVSLVVLVVQNSALVLTMRYSRILPGPRYLPSTAVVISEILKCIICLAVRVHEKGTKSQPLELPLLSDETPVATGTSFSRAMSELYSEVFSAKSGFHRLAIPAVLYTIQNNLQYIAASNLDAATFQITYQCKILTTALFAVILLRQSLSITKWVSLLILTLGVACVQIPSGIATHHTEEGSYILGLLAVAIACICSGFAGVYFEKVLKSAPSPSSTNIVSTTPNPSTSLWVRNIQLSVSCLVIALTGTLAWDGRKIYHDGFFYGYNFITIATICIQAAGGLIVAMVIKYADNILKGFATSLSIVLSTVMSIYIFNFVVTIYFGFGAILVFIATWLYGMTESRTSQLKDEIDQEESKYDENVPILVVDDYDEKTREETDREKDVFRDEAIDLESQYGGNGSRLASFDEQQGHDFDADSTTTVSRNVSPNLLQGAWEKEKEVCHELGTVT